MIQKVLLLLLPLVFWSACRQDSDLPDPVDGMPVFSVEYTADTLPARRVTAGLDRIYLFSGYATDGQDVLTCTGTFTSVQCLSDTCAGRLTFEFRNTRRGQVVLTDSLFHLGEYSFKTNAPPAGPTVYRTTFRADTTLGYTDFFWLFEDQYAAQGSLPTLDFSSTTDSIRVELQATRNSGPTSRVQRRVSLAGSDTAFPRLDLSITPQANTYRLEAVSSGASVTGLSWNNGTMQSTFEQDSLQPSYTVTALDMAGQAGNAASARLQELPANPGVTLRTANFTHLTTVAFLPADTLQLGTIALQWTDALGQVWRSDQGPQEPNMVFQVLEMGPYELNEQGQKTWQMQVSFTCQLYSLNTGERIVFAGKGHIAVAYP